jgi:hypothetical protein
VLHEVAHWYCLQLLRSRYGKLPLWFCEGLADHAAFHTWDGKTLQAMRLPRVSLENYPARLDALLKRMRPSNAIGEISLNRVSECFGLLRSEPNTNAANAIYDEYALAWGLVAFLVEKFPQEMTLFFELLRQHDAQISWHSAFENCANQPTWPQLVDWVAGRQLPWQWVWNHWEDTGSQLLGLSDSTAMIVQNPAYKTQETAEEQHESEVILLRCEVVPQLNGTVIGLVFHFVDSESFEMLQFRNIEKDDTEWRHVRFAQKTWESLSQWQKIETTSANNVRGHGVVIEIRDTTSPHGHQLWFLYNNSTVTELSTNDSTRSDTASTKVHWPFGLAVLSGAAQFRERW